MSEMLSIDFMQRALLAALLVGCLLYTSDAADERSSVDLGGRRIIKKKKHCRYARAWTLLICYQRHRLVSQPI